MEEYYNILEVSPTDKINDIRRSYKKKAKTYYSTNKINQDDTEYFLEIYRAYRILVSHKRGKRHENSRYVKMGTKELHEEMRYVFYREAMMIFLYMLPQWLLAGLITSHLPYDSIFDGNEEYRKGKFYIHLSAAVLVMFGLSLVVITFQILEGFGLTSLILLIPIPISIITFRIGLDKMRRAVFYPSYP